MIFKRFKYRKLIRRFIELDNERKILEDNGCMKRSCSTCVLLTRINEHISTCPHEKCGDEMWQIYKMLFPKESPYEHTWKQKVERVRKISTT